MKPEEKTLFETFMTVHPDFLEAKSWVEGPEPPDVIVTDARSRDLGVELTEWLISGQTTHSITIQEHEHKWLTALESESHPQPAHFAFVQISFRPETEFSRDQQASFCQEFYDLMSYVDGAWDREMAATPQKLWNDFSSYPTLGKQVHFIRFQDRAPFRPSEGARWAFGMGKGGAYDPRWATSALLERIREKRTKANYAALKTQLRLAELVLLVYYGIRGLMHNTPFDGVNWKLEDTIREARAELAPNPGPFDRVFLYLAYNEGQLFTLYASP